MNASRRALLGMAATAPAAATFGRRAYAAPPLRIAVLTDMTDLLSGISSEGSVLAARMAVEDFGNGLDGRAVEPLLAGHQNKPDVGKQHYPRMDRDQRRIRGGGRAHLLRGPGRPANLPGYRLHRPVVWTRTLRPDRAELPALGFHWTYDTYALAKGVGATLVCGGGDSWFFMTDDYAFGLALKRDTARFVEDAGGKVISRVRFPMGSSDFSSFLLQAQNSGAKVIGLATASSDTSNALKQAKEFGIPGKGKTLAGLQVFLNDVHAVGLDACQGLIVAESFYWDLNDKTRAWSRRFQARSARRAMPSMLQAGTYSAVLHYLRSVQAAGTDAGAAVADRMRTLPVNDFMNKDVSIRADGRVMCDMHVFRVKTPEQNRGAWDDYELVESMTEASAFRPLAEGRCLLVKA